LKGEGNLTKKQQTILDDNIYNSYLQRDDVKLKDRKQINKKGDFQKLGMEIT